MKNDWDTDQTVQTVEAPINPSHLAAPDQTEASEKAPRITSQAPARNIPEAADPWPKTAEIVKDKLTGDAVKTLALLSEAQLAVDRTPPRFRSPRNPQWVADYQRLSTIKAHFHALQQGLPTIDLDANHQVAAQRGRIAAIETREAKLTQVQRQLQAGQKALPAIPEQTDTIKRRLVADSSVVDKLLQAHWAALQYESAYLERAADLHIEDHVEFLKLEIGRTEDPEHRRGLVDDLNRLTSEGTRELTAISAREIRAAFVPTQEAIKGLFAVVADKLKAFKADAEADERKLAESWEVDHAPGNASRQFDRLIGEAESLASSKPVASHPMPNIPGSHSVVNPHGLLSWFGIV